MKKVCHITTVHEAFDTRIFHKEARSLAKVGYDVTLIAPHEKNETVEGVKIVALPKPKNRFSRMVFLAKKAYKLALKQKADIYHFHDPEFLQFALKLKKKTGAKIIYDVHEDVSRQILSKTWIPKIFRKTISKIFNYYEKRKAKKLDFIIVVTPEIKKYFEKEKIKNIETITNYPIIDYFNKKKDFSRKKNGAETILIYAGVITKIRGVKEIVKSLSFVKKNARLVLAGKFQEKKIEGELKKMPEWKMVDFKGFF